MRMVRFIALLVLASVSHACSPGMPGVGGGGKGESNSSESSDSVSIDKPTMVGGGYVTGYLACQFDTKVPAEATAVGFKCRMENAGQKILLPPNSNVNHSVYDANDNRLQEVVLSPEDESSSSHWRGSVDRAFVSNLRVETVINYDGNVLARSTYVNDPPNSDGTGTTPQQGSVNLIGANHTYIFGSLAETPACAAERKKGGDTAVFAESNLQSLTLAFNAPQDTFIDVDLFHLCNLDDAEPLVQLFRAGETKALKKASLSEQSGLNDQRVLKRFEIKAGRYELQILVSASFEKKWENAFSLGDIQITSTRAIDPNIEVRPSILPPLTSSKEK